VIIPDDIQSTCCGQLFSSKGFSQAYQHTANNTISKLWEWTQQGAYPVVLDVSSCSQTIQHSRGVLTPENRDRFDKMVIIDSIDYLHDHVLISPANIQKKDNIVLHPVCTLQKMKLTGKLVSIAKHYANNVAVPITAGCCGMAGDRGFLFPELTAAATAPEANEVKERSYEGYYSTAKTCEMALSDAVGKNYESILYLADECTH
jgi:D-lactate dehydrogenase